MNHQLEFAYIGFEVADVEALRGLFTDVVGLVPGDGSAGVASTFRNDDRAARVFVEEGPRDDCSVLGFVATDERAFDEVTARLAAVGFPLDTATDAEAAGRGVGR